MIAPHDLALVGAFLKGQEDYHTGEWGFVGLPHDCAECRSQYAAGYAYELNVSRRDIHIGGMIWSVKNDEK